MWRPQRENVVCFEVVVFSFAPRGLPDPLGHSEAVPLHLDDARPTSGLGDRWPFKMIFKIARIDGHFRLFASQETAVSPAFLSS